MSEASGNPCLSCSISQDCCRHLSGLKLTEAEYRQLFHAHRDVLDVQRSGPLYVVSGGNGGACPHWGPAGCTVYDQRPSECRLFPYSTRIRHDGRRVRIAIHTRTRCPLKSRLLGSEQEARRLATALARGAFGPDCELDVQREGLWAGWKSRLWRLATRLLRHKTGPAPGSG